MSGVVVDFKVPEGRGSLVSVEVFQTGKRGKEKGYALNDISGFVMKSDRSGAALPCAFVCTREDICLGRGCPRGFCIFIQP